LSQPRHHGPCMAPLASRVVRALWFRATLALLAVYAVALPLGLLGGSMARQALQAQGWAHQTEHVVNDVQDLQLAMYDQDAGLRGYVLTAGQSFLTEYAAGRIEVRSAWSALAGDAAGSGLESGLPQLKA